MNTDILIPFLTAEDMPPAGAHISELPPEYSGLCTVCGHSFLIIRKGRCFLCNNFKHNPNYHQYPLKYVEDETR